MDKQDYEVVEAGWLDGAYREAGAVISMSAIEAEHLAIAGSIRRKEEKPARQAKPDPKAE